MNTEITLAATFHPRGETARLERIYPYLLTAYQHLIISLPPDVSEEDADIIAGLPGVQSYVNTDWSHGRYQSLRLAAASDASAVHYCDLDRLLRWVEIYPEEWRRTLIHVGKADCLVIGRTETAWASHPQALRQTEAISSGLFSRLLSQSLDLSAGSKGFSRRALTCLMANTVPGRAIGTDSEWIVILYRAGFTVESVLVDGLDWEIPDQHQAEAASRERQHILAAQYDADPSRWAHRVKIAHEIIEAGMDAWVRPLQRGI